MKKELAQNLASVLFSFQEKSLDFLLKIDL